MICPKCGKEIQDNSSFCRVCGAKLSVDNPSFAEPVAQAPASATPKNRKPLILAISAVALILVLFIVIFIIRSNSPSSRFQEQLELGNRYLSEMNYEQAVAAFEAAIEIDPKNVEAYKGLVDAYIQMGDDQLAIEIAQRAYDATGDDSFQDIINELTTDSMLPTESSVYVTENVADTEDDFGIHGEYVNGIYHHNYGIYDMTSEYCNLLDMIIDYTSSGDKEMMLDVIKRPELYNISYIYKDEDGFYSDCLLDDHREINCTTWIAYRDYKIYINAHKDTDINDTVLYVWVDISCIPITNGTGSYAQYVYKTIGNVEGQGTDYWFDIVQCEDGMFNGEAVLYGSHLVDNPNRRHNESLYSIYSGIVSNGMRVGKWKFDGMNDAEITSTVYYTYDELGRKVSNIDITGREYPCSDEYYTSVQVSYLPTETENGLVIYPY